MIDQFNSFIRPAKATLRPLAAMAGLWLALSGVALAQAANFSEAPALTEMVTAGKLPSLVERLPEAPMVVKGAEEGVYGGTIRLNGLSSDPWPFRYFAGSELLFRFNNDQKVEPQLAESYEVNADATQYTIHLRKGVKWSDGVPFTVDDILFWNDDIAMSQEFNPGMGLNGWFGGYAPNYRTSVGGKTTPPKMEKIDDYTFKITFPVPNGIFVIGAATSENDAATRLPKHYLQQFHPRYNPDVQKLAESEGFPDWMALMRAKMDWWLNPDVPTLHAWSLKAGLGSSPVVEAVRNPYYWKVDAAGHQLPYVDTIRWSDVEDNEVALLQTLAGDVDFKFETALNSVDNRALFLDNAARGHFRLAEVSPSPVVTSFDLNLTVKDPIKREVFRNKDFRIGLSYAMDRDEINDLVYLGQRSPQQFAPTPGSPVYDEEFANQYVEHDVVKANQYLDRVLPNRGADGFRLGPDGKPFSFTLETHANAPDRVSTIELMQHQFEAVGIKTDILTLDANLLRERRTGNDFDSHLGVTTTGNLAVILNFMPFPIYTWPNNDEYNGTLWTNWYLGISPSEEPPAEVKQALDLFAQIKATADQDKQVALARKMLAIDRDLFMTMGTVRNAPSYAIVADTLRNVEEPIFSQPFAPGTIHPELLFYAAAK